MTNDWPSHVRARAVRMRWTRHPSIHCTAITSLAGTIVHATVAKIIQ